MNKKSLISEIIEIILESQKGYMIYLERKEMNSRYLIFRESILNGPIPIVDKEGNSVPSLSKEEAEALVNEQNRKLGKVEFFSMSIPEWEQKFNSSEIQKCMEDMDTEMEKIMKKAESNLTDIREKAYMDKSINGFRLPIIVDTNGDYEKILKEKLEAFIKEIDRPLFQDEKGLVDDVKKISKQVLDAFECVKQGEIEKAEKIVIEILKDYTKNEFAVTDLDKSYAFRGIAPFKELRHNWVNKNIYESMIQKELNFFRARTVSNEDTTSVKRVEDIVYLPYDLRNNSNDMRFSKKGEVCLYLGVTSYVCSKECRWDEENQNLYLSAFRFNEKGKRLKILNLICTESLMNGLQSSVGSNDKEYDTKLHNDMVRVFPLIMATSFTIKNPDKEKRYEYLLSQVLIKVLNDAGIDGVAYLSAQGESEFEYPQFVNLAIPIKDTDENNKYGKLINYFEMTEPVLYNEFVKDKENKNKSYINEIYSKSDYNSHVVFKGKDIPYQETKFSSFDDYLINQKYMRISNITDC